MYGIGDMCFGWNQIMCVLKIKEKGGMPEYTNGREWCALWKKGIVVYSESTNAQYISFLSPTQECSVTRFGDHISYYAIDLEKHKNKTVIPV